MEYVSSSLSETKRIGKELARKIIKSAKRKKNPTHATVIGLAGELGAGKTSFTRSFLRALGARGKISSPTFVLMKKHATKDSHYSHGFHVDAYRIRGSKEMAHLGFRQIIKDPRHIVLIEWADKIRRIMPKGTIWIRFEHLKGNKRRITAKGIA